MKEVRLVGCVAAFCISTMAPRVPEVVLPLLYERCRQRGPSHPGCFRLPFAPVRNEQLGLRLLIIRLVWLSLFALWSCASQPPLPSHRNELKVIGVFFRRLHKLFRTRRQSKQIQAPKQLFFVPSLICQRYCLGCGKHRKDYHREHSRHKELMGCQYPWQRH